MTGDLHSLAAAYALDALDADERAEFEAHLATCVGCTADVAEFAEVTAALGESGDVAPPAHLRGSILSQLGDVEQATRLAEAATPDDAGPAPRPTGRSAEPVTSLAGRRPRTRSIPVLLAAAAAIVLVAVGAVLIIAGGGGTGYDDVASASDAVVTVLAGESGSVEVAYSAELDRVALRGSGFDDLAPGLRYALWAIADGTPVPAGLFEPEDGAIDGVAELADVSAQAWGITVEPETGSAAPTSEIIYYADV